jgi:hypothetical protein
VASNASFIASTVRDVSEILNHFEAIQAISARRSQEWIAGQTVDARTGLTGLTLDGGEDGRSGDFAGMTFTEDQFADVQTALNAMPNIMGGWAVVFYRIKE